MSAELLWIPAILTALTCVGLLLSRSWRWSLLLLATQYFAAFWLVQSHWPLTMSAAKLVSGWMAAAVLGMTHLNFRKDDPTAEPSWPEGRLFRIFASGLVLLAISAALPSLRSWLPDASLPLLWGGLALVSLGFLYLGMTLQPFRVILGLLTTLSGFEVFYSTMENSILVAGLLALITLGLALTGCYLLMLDSTERFA